MLYENHRIGKLDQVPYWEYSNYLFRTLNRSFLKICILIHFILESIKGLKTKINSDRYFVFTWNSIIIFLKMTLFKIRHLDGVLSTLFM